MYPYPKYRLYRYRTRSQLMSGSFMRSRYHIPFLRLWRTIEDSNLNTAHHDYYVFSRHVPYQLGLMVLIYPIENPQRCLTQSGALPTELIQHIVPAPCLKTFLERHTRQVSWSWRWDSNPRGQSRRLTRPFQSTTMGLQH